MANTDNDGSQSLEVLQASKLMTLRECRGIRPQTLDLAGIRIDKEHLTPLADIAYRYGLKAAEETFQMGNAVPQPAANNQGVMELLESMVSGINRNGRYQPGWVDIENQLWIITGPGFSSPTSWSKGLKSLPTGIPIPTFMFKVIATGTRQAPKILCFMIRNEDLPKSVETVRESVTSLEFIEKATGIELFPDLSPEVRAKIGSNKSSLGWIFPELVSKKHYSR